MTRLAHLKNRVPAVNNMFPWKESGILENGSLTAAGARNGTGDAMPQRGRRQKLAQKLAQIGALSQSEERANAGR
jgi:hypothetical protein